MPANRPVSLKLDPRVHERITALAKALNRSTHDLVQDAIAQYVDREERREALRQDDFRAWESYQRSGIHATEREADGWMARKEANREPASAFYQRLSATCGTDIDIDSVIRENGQNTGEP